MPEEKSKDKDLRLIFNSYGLRWIILYGTIENVAKKLKKGYKENEDVPKFCMYNDLVGILRLMDTIGNLSDDEIIKCTEEIKENDDE